MKKLLRLATVSILATSLACTPASTDARTQTVAKAAPLPNADEKPPIDQPISITPPEIEPEPTATEESVQPPVRITGAYMTAAILPAEASASSIMIGIKGMIDENRLSDSDDLYKSTWALGFSEAIPVIVKIAKSTDKQYDQLLEFYGSDAQLRELAIKIDISLMFQENRNGAIVSSMVVNSLADLIP